MSKKLRQFIYLCSILVCAFICNFKLTQVYPNELESQPEFDGFSEWLQTFDLYRGKKSEEEFEDENRVVHACLNKCHGKHRLSSKEAMMVELWADKVYELANQPCVYVPFQT